MDRKTVIASISALERDGWIQIDRADGRGNRYTLNLEKEENTSTKNGTATSTKNGTGTGKTEPVPKTVLTSTKNGTDQYQKRDTNQEITRKYPGSTQRAREENEKTFLEFWANYPRKKSKGQAERAWQKLSEQEQQLAIAILPDASRQPDWTKQGGRYIPYPATWLNAKGWEDDITPSGRNRGARSDNWLDDGGNVIEGSFTVEKNHAAK